MEKTGARYVRFDIIMPLHMMERVYVLRAIDSVLNQSHRKWRLTIVETPASAKKNGNHWKDFIVELDDSRFHHCIESSKGISAARNQAAECERSDYIAFLDGDDAWEPNHLEIMANAIATSQEEVVMWWARLGKSLEMKSLMNGRTQTKVLEYSPYEGLELFSPNYYYYYFMVHPAYPSSFVVRRDAFQAIGGFDPIMLRCEDQDLVMRLLHPTKGQGIAQFVDSLSVIREPSRESHKIAAEEKDYVQELVDRYPWPQVWEKPDELLEDVWEDMLEHIYETRHKNFTLK